MNENQAFKLFFNSYIQQALGFEDAYHRQARVKPKSQQETFEVGGGQKKTIPKILKKVLTPRRAKNILDQIT